MRKVAFEREGFDQFTKWASENPKLFQKIVRVINETAREPSPASANRSRCATSYAAIGRRITEEHRLVYRVTARHDNDHSVPGSLLTDFSPPGKPSASPTLRYRLRPAHAEGLPQNLWLPDE